MEPYRFNHGAQFFTARSAPFRALIESALEQGTVEQWAPRLLTLDPTAEPFKRTWFEPHYVAKDGMNGLAKTMTADVDLSVECHITEIVKVDDAWFLNDSSAAQHGPFDWVISTAPASQAQALLPPCFQHLDALEGVQFSPCFALMLGFEQPVEFGFEAAVIKNSGLAWTVASKGATSSTLLIHSNNHWASEHLEQDLDWVQHAMLEELAGLLPKPLPVPSHIQLHRWRFARCESPISQRHLLDLDNGLGVCGDWCGGNRVEDAFSSGMSLAKQLKTFIEAK
jgi:predicted NAD/FAD-dependent oxidoreductase